MLLKNLGQNRLVQPTPHWGGKRGTNSPLVGEKPTETGKTQRKRAGKSVPALPTKPKKKGLRQPKKVQQSTLWYTHIAGWNIHVFNRIHTFIQSIFQPAMLTLIPECKSESKHPPKFGRSSQLFSFFLWGCHVSTM